MINELYCSNKHDIQKFDWGEVIWLHEPSNLVTQRLSASLVKFFPGKKQLRHVHFGEEQILYVLEGTGLNVVNGKEEKVSKGMLIHCPPYSEHEVENTGNEDLVFLITYAPSKLVEVHQSLAVSNNKHILDIVDREVLENIQKEISELLKLSVGITDSNNNYVTEPINLHRFCDLCKKMNVCKERQNKYESALKGLDKVFICCNNIIIIIIPILVGEEIIGYVKCGHFLLNKSVDIKRNIENNYKRKIKNIDPLLAAYNEIPIIMKSRFYALEESLSIVSRIISNIIENNLVDKQLKEKNNEILKNAKEKLYLEDALKQANIKLLRSQVSSGFDNHKFKPRNFYSRQNIEYPLEMENKLRDTIKKLDETLCEKIISEKINIYREKEFSIEDVKETFEELAVTLARIIYEETNDDKLFLNIRNKYKEEIKGCNNYSTLQEVFIEFSKENIKILKSILLNGKYDIIQKVNLYIENNFNQDINLSFLADMFFITPNYLSTIFNDKNGMSLKDYINKLRIDNAKKYLIETNMKISDISKMVGYNQLSYFGSIFKKLEGCTPNEYRSKSGNK
ncbi:PocR ligand-binding domain-containing protein [Clostridium thailandense]|uniref:PocR ligand-binding domain-containing protein n=1 Tax=Clostridium thailandense TaxID=2794346 RepID=UPI00398A3592